jgi:hypothetical protein
MTHHSAVPGMTQRKTTQFTLRMDPTLKEAAEKAAADDRRSLASLIDRLLEEYCVAGGYLEPDRPLLGLAPRKPTKRGRR